MLQPDAMHCGGYEIVRELAQGVYTAVYEARHTHPKLRERVVTLKLLRHRRGAGQFLQAARLSAALEHPRIPPLFVVGEDAGQLYSARMFVAGDDLQNGIGVPRGLPEVTAVIAGVAEAVDYAHERGVIHGLVHPRHMLWGSDGRAWLIGFGEFPPTEPAALGNPLHLAPEQLGASGAATPASDIYALAETALWLLSGRHPFANLRVEELLPAKLAGRYQRPFRDLGPRIAPALEQVLSLGMAAEPANRYSTAGKFATEFASAARLGRKSHRWWFWR